MNHEAPAQGIISWGRQWIDFEVHATNKYKGLPSPELDAAWEGLFACEHNCYRLYLLCSGH